ncbi:MAG TPA: sugar ABC transporter permease, partial [Clostridiales bacterium]|nr:sugar ABC transporter permease [Clostridiales bacterium]
GIISAFQLFNQPYILTQGGPVNATRTVAMVVFQNAFQYGRMGYASCVAWVLFVVIMAVTLIIQSSSKRWVFYDN